MKVKLIVLLLAILAPLMALGQKAAIKTNLLYDATATLNGGVEVKFAPQWTGDLSANLNAWAIKDHRWKHWLVQPEARYWFCQAYSGHFVGAHLLGGQYNYGNLDMPFKFLGTDFRKLKEYRFQGWMAGAGIAYGSAQVGITLHTRRHCRCYLVETDCLHNTKGVKNKRKQFYAGQIHYRAKMLLHNRDDLINFVAVPGSCCNFHGKSGQTFL